MQKTLDATWGNATFLGPYWEHYSPVQVSPQDHMNYQKHCGLSELKNEIRNIHNFYHSYNVDKYEIVIGHGATQVLQAAISALDSKRVYARPPYFQRFPKIAKLAGKRFVTDRLVGDIEIATYPNNPDGDMSNHFLQGPNSIYDLSYNWPIYTGIINTTEYPLMIYSLSKATGHASARIGWALVQDKVVANKMRDFIEYQSCDVSVPSQVVATDILISENNRARTTPDTVFQYGRRKLIERKKQLEELGVPMQQDCGMFIWSNNPKYFKKRNIEGIKGSAFGVSDDFIRINMALKDEDFEELVRRCQS